MISKTAFLIISCDSYSGLWEAHFKCLDVYWPDCPFPKYILTNHKESGRPDITAIKAGEDLSWSDNLKKALEQLKQEYRYVLVTFDDLFLREKVDNQFLNKVLESFHALNGRFVQLILWHNKPEKVNSLLGLILPGSLYRPNCVYALWDIETLDNLLIPGESAWQFERNGSMRSDRYDGFYTVLQRVFHFRNTVIRGKIIRKCARQYQLTPETPLKVMTISDLIRFRLRYAGFRIFLWITPRKLQVHLSKTKTRLFGR